VEGQHRQAPAGGALLQLGPAGHQAASAADGGHVQQPEGPGDQTGLTKPQQPGQQGIKQPLAPIDGIVEGGGGAGIALEGIEGQGEELLAIVAALALEHHQRLALQAGREGQLIADAGKAGGVAAVLAEHHQGPHQQGQQRGEQSHGCRPPAG
jgi:hypothetical protein